MTMQRVVHIATGEQRDAYVEERGQVWNPNELTKRGVPPRNRYPTGLIGGSFALFVEAREAEANGIRRRMQELRGHLGEEERALRALYAEGVRA